MSGFKRRISVFRTVIFLLLPLLWFGCDSNDNSGSGELTGSYQLVSVTDKTGEFSATAGQSYAAGTATTTTVEDDDGNQFTAELTPSGSLEMNENTYSFSFTILIEVTQGEGTFTATESLNQSGGWSEANGRITFESTNSSDEDDIGTVDFLLDGNRLILEDLDIQMVFEK